MPERRRVRLVLLSLVACLLLAACETPPPPASGTSAIAGRAIAGPTCPVENPDDPTCDPRPVAGALLIVTDPGGTEVARTATDAMGRFRIGLQPGDYVLVPQPVEGLMGTAPPVPFRLAEGAETLLDVGYDTGIR